MLNLKKKKLKAASVDMRAIIAGIVQGVGFRMHVKHLADQLGVKGTVRNLPDRRVEIIAEGDDATLQAFLNKLKTPRGLIRVDTIETFDHPPTSSKDFNIL